MTEKAKSEVTSRVWSSSDRPKHWQVTSRTHGPDCTTQGCHDDFSADSRVDHYSAFGYLHRLCFAGVITRLPTTLLEYPSCCACSFCIGVRIFCSCASLDALGMFVLRHCCNGILRRDDIESMAMTWPNHTLQRTRCERCGCHRCAALLPSLILDRYASSIEVQ